MLLLLMTFVLCYEMKNVVKLRSESALEFPLRLVFECCRHDKALTGLRDASLDEVFFF